MITGIRVGKLTICSCGHRLSAVRPWALALLSAAMILFAASRQQALANASAKVDHDRDDDGLIEVADLHQLNAIRYDLDGDGEPSEIDRPDVLPYKDLRYADAFPEALDDMGCPSTGCVGYELTADLNFDTDRDGHIDSDDLFWSEGRGWFPIGWRLKRADWNIETEFTQFPFVAIFEGNGHTVLNLMSKQIEVPETGWFGLTGAKPVGDEYVTGEVRNVGLVSVEVCSEFNDDDSPATGGLIGLNYGLLINSFATGSVCGTNDTGGLVGINYGTVSASYSHAKVSGLQNVGGLVGSNLGNIIASYATGSVTGEDGVDGSVGSHFGTLDAGYSKGQVNGEDAVGGLIGHAGDESAEPTVVHSYWDTDRSKTSDSAGGEGKSTVHLQQPTGYTGIYAGWNVDLGGDDEGDNPWQFGTEVQYPALNVDFDGDGQANWREFGAQRGANVWASNLAPARGEPVTLTAQLVGVDCDDSSYAWYRVADDGRAYRVGPENEVEKKGMLYRAQSKTHYVEIACTVGEEETTYTSARVTATATREIWPYAVVVSDDEDNVVPVGTKVTLRANLNQSQGEMRRRMG